VDVFRQYVGKPEVKEVFGESGLRKPKGEKRKRGKKDEDDSGEFDSLSRPSRHYEPEKQLHPPLSL